MKHAVFIIVLLRAFAQGSALAQPALTVDNSLPALGESFIELIGIPMDAGGSGPDQMWDLSSFQPTDTLAFTYESAADDSIGGCPLQCPYDLIGGDYVVGFDPARISVAPWFGYPLGTLPTTAECSRMTYLPLGFGGTFIHQHMVHLHTSGCGEIVMWREESSEADAYGSLVLPFGTFGPVLRVHTITGHVAPDGPAMNAYRFYLPGTHHPLVTIAQGFPLPLDTAWSMRMLDPASIVGLPQPTMGCSKITFRPQPVHDVLFVDVPQDLHDVVSVEVLDMSARRMRGYASTALRTGLDVSSLSSGVYVLRISTKGVAALSGWFIKSER